MKVSIRWGKDVINSEWQEKTFKDNIAAMEFIRKHSDNIHGINGELIPEYAKPLNHYDIQMLLEGKRPW